MTCENVVIALYTRIVQTFMSSPIQSARNPSIMRELCLVLWNNVQHWWTAILTPVYLGFDRVVSVISIYFFSIT